MKKSEQHQAIRARAERALLDMYHNATPTYPRDVPDNMQETFSDWFAGTASFEIEYMNDAGAYGKDYPKTLAHPANGVGHFTLDSIAPDGSFKAGCHSIGWAE